MSEERGLEDGVIPGGRRGQPYMISKGEIREGFFGSARSLKRPKGKSLVQSRCSSRESLVRVSLREWLVRSTLPED